MKYISYIRKRFNDPRSPVFRLSELRLIKGLSGGYLKLLIHNLSAKGEIIRITKGVYTFKKDADVLCFAFEPSYYGLEDALSIMGISEQGTNPTILTVRNVRRGVRSFIGRNYSVYHLDKQFFFGYELLRRGDYWIPVSDVEKTVIDLIQFKVYLREELWSEILPKMDMKKLATYLEKYPPSLREAVTSEIKRHKKTRRSLTPGSKIDEDHGYLYK